MAELIITLPDGRTYPYTLVAGEAIIGRDSACEIAIDDPSASRQHARFSSAPNGFILEDMGSKNGTLVNDGIITSKLLAEGDRIQVGSTTVVFKTRDRSLGGSVVIADEPTQSHATRYISKDQQILLSQHRLEMIYQLSEKLTTLQSKESLFENALDICFQTLGFERGALGVRRKDSRVLDWPVVRNLQSPEGGLTISRTLLTRALEHGERAIFTDDGLSGSDPTVSMVQQGIRSAMCVPLLHQDEVLGIIYGDRLSTVTPYTHEDIDFFAGIAQQVSIGLINCNLLESQEQMVRLNQEIDFARRIQTELFPTELPKDSTFRVGTLNDPGHRVSGDYYDVIPFSDHRRWWLLIADVTGEGVAAALLMANLQAAVRVTSQETDDPAELLVRWNRLIWSNTDSSRFITCLLALADPVARTIRLASAGHHALMMIKSKGDEVQELECEAGFPLGVVEDSTYSVTEASLGDENVSVYCYTDGVIEAMNSASEQYGKERLIKILLQHRTAAPEALVRHVRKDIIRFVGAARQSDDITMLAARFESDHPN